MSQRPDSCSVNAVWQTSLFILLISRSFPKPSDLTAQAAAASQLANLAKGILGQVFLSGALGVRKKKNLRENDFTKCVFKQWKLIVIIEKVWIVII